MNATLAAETAMMKKKLAWLALPVLMGALVWGVKWRAEPPIEFPTPTKEDLELRAMMSRTMGIDVVHFSVSNEEQAEFLMLFAREDLKAFVDCFHVTPESAQNQLSSAPPGTFSLWFSLPESRDPGDLRGFNVKIGVKDKKRNS